MDEMGEDVLEEHRRGRHLTVFAFHYISLLLQMMNFRFR